MHREYHRWASPNLGQEMELIVLGHYGPPVVVFPSSMGEYYQWEDQGMFDFVAGAIVHGQVKFYCVQSLDRDNWYHRHISQGDMSRHYHAFERYISDEVLGFVQHSSGGLSPLLMGASFGAYHAVNLYLRKPYLYRGAMAMSGVYSLNFLLGAHLSQEAYFHSPIHYLGNMHLEAELQRLREQGNISLFVGQGAFEDRTLPSTRDLCHLLHVKGIPHRCEFWGHDAEHHWYWWMRQLEFALSMGWHR